MAEPKKKKQIAAGFTCECGQRHQFDVYVNAHWSEELIHTCSACGRKHSVSNGKTKTIKASTKDRMSDLPETPLPAAEQTDNAEVHCRGTRGAIGDVSSSCLPEVQKIFGSRRDADMPQIQMCAVGAEDTAAAPYLSGLVDHGRIDCARAEDWLRRLPVTCDLIFGSPPYTDARAYRDSDGKMAPMFKDANHWAYWMASIYQLCLEKCRGLVAFVVAGRTRKFSYNGAPHLLVAELLRRGVCLRNPPIFHRRGISGSGGPDYLRSDYEHIVVASNGGRLPWACNTAVGNAPKYGPGGAMSHRMFDGSRRGGKQKDRVVTGSPRKPTAEREIQEYKPPKIANPGNVFYVPVGGGRMGHPLAHKNEAPFPEGIVRPFVLSFCPPGGIVGDPFAGSGTTLAVAKKFGRIGIGCDIRDNQCAITRERLASVIWQEGLK